MHISTRLIWPVAAVAALVLVACRANHTPTAAAAAAPSAVHFAEVSSGPAEPMVRASGLLVAKDATRLSFKVGGIVSRLDVQEGDAVKRGQLLATIEQTEVAAVVEQARVLKEKSARDLKRGEALYAESVISLEQVQDLRTQAQLAAAQLAQASFNREYARIEAPHDGIILRRLVEVREQVAPGQPILAVSSLDAGFVLRAALADRDVVRARLGDAATVTMDAYPDAQFDAAVSEVASAADEKTGLFMVEVKLKQAPPRISSGMVGKLTLQPTTDALAPLAYVPLSAIVDGAGRRASAFVAQNGVAKRVALEIAFIDREQVAVRSGLTPGQTVVTDGALFLSDGERVTLKKE
jgi:membrane fusion protein, multidrug efflux system